MTAIEVAPVITPHITPRSDTRLPVMAMLAAGIPLTLLADLADPEGLPMVHAEEHDGWAPTR